MQHLRRQSLLLGDEHDEATRKIFHTRLLQRWLLMVQLTRGAEFFVKQFTLLEYVRSKKAAEGRKNPNSIHVNARSLRRYQKALSVIQAAGRVWSDRKYEEVSKLIVPRSASVNTYIVTPPSHTHRKR